MQMLKQISKSRPNCTGGAGHPHQGSPSAFCLRKRCVDRLNLGAQIIHRLGEVLYLSFHVADVAGMVRHFFLPHPHRAAPAALCSRICATVSPVSVRDQLIGEKERQAMRIMSALVPTEAVVIMQFVWVALNVITNSSAGSFSLCDGLICFSEGFEDGG
jgi:hypothetical protein